MKPFFKIKPIIGKTIKISSSAPTAPKDVPLSFYAAFVKTNTWQSRIFYYLQGLEKMIGDMDQKLSW